MRLATCALALALASTSLTTQIADACGGYGVDLPPQVMLISEHSIPGKRAFVVMSDRTPADTDRFELLAPRSYDNTLIMDMGALSHPMTFTLVGGDGIRVVTADRRVALKHAFWTSRSNVDAMEITVKQNERFAIALHGYVSDAKWHSWSRAKDLGITATHDEFTGHTLRAGHTSLGTYRGSIRGVLETNGKRYVVMQQGTQTRLVKVPARS